MHNERDELLSSTTRNNLIFLSISFLGFLVLQALGQITGIIAMLAGALLLTYLLLAPIRGFEAAFRRIIPKQFHAKPGFRRILSIIAVYILFLGSCSFVATRIAPPLIQQGKEFGKDMPVYVAEIDNFLSHVEKSISHSDPTTWGKRLSTPRPPIPFKLRHKGAIEPVTLVSNTAKLSLEKMKDIGRQAGRLLLNAGALTINGFVYALTALMFAFYLLKDGRMLRNGVAHLMPNHHESTITRFLHRIHMQLYSLIKAQALMSILSGCLVYCVLVFCGVKYALLLGIFFGMMAFLPILGPWLGLLPIAVILNLGDHYVGLLIVLMVMGIFHVVKACWLWPQLLHARFRVIHPVVFILTLLVCIHLAGFSGLLMVFPLVCILTVALDMLKAQSQEKHVAVASPWGTGEETTNAQPL